MAIRELNNFTQFASAAGMGSSLSRFSNFDSTNFAFEASGLGVHGGNTIRMQETVGDFYHSHTANLSGNRHMHAAFYLHTPSTLAAAEWLRFSNGTADQCRFTTNSSGDIMVSAWEPSGWSVIATASAAFSANTIHHVEVHYDKDNSGAVNVWVDGVQVMAFTGDTYNGSSLTWGRTWFGWLGGNTKLDSVALWDVATDAAQGDFAASLIGPHRIEYLHPTGAGTYGTWTPNTGGAAAAVDDVIPDNDTTYIDDTGRSNGDKHSFALGDLAWNPETVYTVMAYAIQRRTSSGALPVSRLLLRSGSAEEIHSHDGIMSTAFSPARSGFDDINGTALSAAVVNALEVGIEVATVQATSQIRLTEIFAAVLATVAEPSSESESESEPPPSESESEPPSEVPSESESEPPSEVPSESESESEPPPSESESESETPSEPPEPPTPPQYLRLRAAPVQVVIIG